jgi:hypothetical protein
MILGRERVNSRKLRIPRRYQSSENARVHLHNGLEESIANASQNDIPVEC